MMYTQRMSLHQNLFLVAVIAAMYAVVSSSSIKYEVDQHSGGEVISGKADIDSRIELEDQQAGKGLSIMGRDARDEPPPLRADPCPSRCQCSSHGRVVRCERLKLREIPPHIPTTVTELYLGYNSLTVIPENSFSTLTNLTVLSLKGNIIIDIRPGAFNQLKKLKSLFLTNNKLVSIPNGVFVDLDSLQKVYLTQNVLSSIPDLSAVTTLTKLNLDNNKLSNFTFPSSYSDLTQLTSLVLNDNPSVIALMKDDLKPLAGAKIAKLDLSRCGIKTIQNDTFSHLVQLKSLQLNYLSLSKDNIKEVVNGLEGSQLTALGLSNSLEEEDLPADTFAALMDVPLQQLTLSNNKISVIRSGLFSYFPKLTLLDFSHSSIIVADVGAFEGLNSLTTLRMHLNDFNELPSDLPATLTSVDFSFNPFLTSIENDVFIRSRSLTELRLHHCSITTIHEGAFSGIEQLKYLDLSYNKIAGNAFGLKVFKDLNALTYLMLQHNNIANIKGESDVFAGLSSLDYLDLHENHLEEIPQGIFAPLKKLRFLHLENNVFGRILTNREDVFGGMTNLVELHLGQNQIRHLPGGLFSALPKLKQVFLWNNEIGGWDGQLFRNSPQLSLVDLSSNQLAVINVTSVEGLKTPLALNLTKNPFDCHCDLIWFRNWVNTTNITLLDLGNYTCASPTKMAGRPLLAFDPESIKFECNWLVTTVVSVSLVAAIFIFSVSMGYHFRWKLRWYMYQFRRRMAPHHTQRVGEYESLAGDNFLYDAFISVSDCDEDDDFIRDHLLLKMDNGWTADGEAASGGRAEHSGSFKLFYEQLHLKRGYPASRCADTMEEARKIIIIMSNAYLRQARCRHFDYEIAMAKVHKYGYAAIIVVMMPDSFEEALPSGLKPKLDDPQTNQEVLYWTDNEDGQQTFWEKLTDQLEYQPEPNIQV